MSKKCCDKKKKCPEGCIGPRGPAGTTPPFVPTFYPISKVLGATFYDTNNDGVVGPGDVFEFTLEGPNDPIEREDAGTFLLPFPGLYKISWQIPINEPSDAEFALGGRVQSTLTTQAVDEGSFDSVPGGVTGKGSPVSQLVGETIVEAVRHNQPVRIENTSNIPVTYFTGIPENPNQRVINIASLIPQREDALGFLENRVAEVVASNNDVTFSDGSGFPGPTGSIGVNGGIAGVATVNMGVTPSTAPYSGLVIQRSGKYVVEWIAYLPADLPVQQNGKFLPYVNGVPIAATGSTGPVSRSSSGRILMETNLNVGDVVTLRNQSPVPITFNTSSPIPNAYLGLYSVFTLTATP